MTRPTNVDLPSLRLKRTVDLQPDIRIRNMKRYWPWELTRGGSNFDFIVRAYLAMLGRWPDRSGINQYIPLLDDNRIRRIDVLINLKNSEEGQKVKAPVNLLITYRKIVSLKNRIFSNRKKSLGSVVSI